VLFDGGKKFQHPYEKLLFALAPTRSAGGAHSTPQTIAELAERETLGDRWREMERGES